MTLEDLKRLGLPIATGGEAARAGDAVSITLQDITATGTIIAKSRGDAVEVELDGTLARVWVPSHLITRRAA